MRGTGIDLDFEIYATTWVFYLYYTYIPHDSSLNGHLQVTYTDQPHNKYILVKRWRCIKM
jgi:hypothetical protein